MVLNKLEMLSEIPLRMNNKTEQVYTSKIYVSMTISLSLCTVPTTRPCHGPFMYLDL